MRGWKRFAVFDILKVGKLRYQTSELLKLRVFSRNLVVQIYEELNGNGSQIHIKLGFQERVVHFTTLHYTLL